jgi:hypothetical protein
MKITVNNFEFNKPVHFSFNDCSNKYETVQSQYALLVFTKKCQCVFVLVEFEINYSRTMTGSHIFKIIQISESLLLLVYVLLYMIQKNR